MSYRICNFPKPDGVPCGSPALRGRKLCFYNYRDCKRQHYAGSAIRRADVLGPRLPPMRSLKDVQVALNEVMQALVADSVPLSRTGRILVQPSAGRNPSPPAREVPEVAMQPLTAEDFTDNSFVCANFRGFPPKPMNLEALQIGGGGICRTGYGAMCVPSSQFRNVVV